MQMSMNLIGKFLLYTLLATVCRWDICMHFSTIMPSLFVFQVYCQTFFILCLLKSVTGDILGKFTGMNLIKPVCDSFIDMDQVYQDTHLYLQMGLCIILENLLNS